MDAGELRVLARLIATVTIGTVIGSAESDVAKPTADGIEEESVTATLTDANISTRDAVMRRLEADPEVDASAVGVAARDGTVTLTGYIDSYPSKLAAERAAKRVPAVHNGLVTLTGQVEWPFQKRVSEKPHRVGWRSRCECRM